MLIDLHSHTSEGSPDSRISAIQFLSLAKQHQLDGVCITEHDSFDSKEAVERASTATELLVWQGIEISTDYGHVLCYGISSSSWENALVTTAERGVLRQLIEGRERTGPSPLLEDGPPEQKRGITWTARAIIQEARHQKGCAAMAHPFAYAGEGVRTLHQLLYAWMERSGNHYDLGQFLKFVQDADPEFIEILELVDAIEVCNGAVTVFENHMAHRLAMELGKPGLGGSDTHHAIMVGQCGSLFDDDIESMDDLVQSIKDRRVRAVCLGLNTAWKTPLIVPTASL